MTQKSYFLLILFFPATISLLLTVSFLIKPKTIEITSSIETNELVIEEKEIIEEPELKIILTGDIMLDRGVAQMVNKYGAADYKFPFSKIVDYLKTADLIFGNLESIISDQGTKVGSIYSFRAQPKAIEGLKFAGFNVLSLANNHAFDYGRQALEDCLKRLKNEGIDYLGIGFSEREAYSVVIKEIKGTKIGFLAYTNLGPAIWRAQNKNSGLAWISENDLVKISQDIKNAKAQVDILIVSLHAGEEYQKTPTAFQTKFAHLVIEAGADIVVGHHPHVVQPNEIYRNGYIFYSLGNFIFDQNFSLETMQGQIVEILIQNKQIKKVEPIYIQLNEFFQPNLTN